MGLVLWRIYTYALVLKLVNYKHRFFGRVTHEQLISNSNNSYVQHSSWKEHHFLHKQHLQTDNSARRTLQKQSIKTQLKILPLLLEIQSSSRLHQRLLML